MLHIGLDGSRIAKSRYTGTEHYSHAIFENLFRVAPHHRYTIYAPAESTKPLSTGRAQVEWKIIPFPKLWTQFRLSWEMATQSQPDVLFVPSHTIPLIHPRATVTTVHDLGFRRFPEYYGQVERAYQNLGLRLATQFSTEIIAVSSATARDLTRYTSYPKKQIHVVHHGVDREHFTQASPHTPPPRWITPFRPYLYSIGRLEAKKNVPQLIRGFRILKEKYRIPHHLFLAGKRGAHGYEEVQSALDSLPSGIRDQVKLLGYVSDQQHALWLRFAEALLFPSGFEGFGLPVLEAMSSGVPVITSNDSSLPEIVGDAGILVNHTRAEAIAEGTIKLLRRPTLRASLIAKGLERVRVFSWESAARKTIAVLEKAAHSKTTGSSR